MYICIFVWLADFIARIDIIVTSVRKMEEIGVS